MKEGRMMDYFTVVGDKGFNEGCNERKYNILTTATTFINQLASLTRTMMSKQQ